MLPKFGIVSAMKRSSKTIIERNVHRFQLNSKTIDISFQKYRNQWQNNKILRRNDSCSTFKVDKYLKGLKTTAQSIDTEG